MKSLNVQNLAVEVEGRNDVDTFIYVSTDCERGVASVIAPQDFQAARDKVWLASGWLRAELPAVSAEWNLYNYTLVQFTRGKNAINVTVVLSSNFLI